MSAEMPYYSKDFATLVNDLLDHFQSPGGGRTPLTDTTEGSVVRTLVEAFARELAVCYEQLHKVYRYGYLDTAESVALDNVVALLGISRYQAGHVEGSVTFSRQQPAPEDIPIPAGTLVTGRDIPLFETVGNGSLNKGEVETTVGVRAVEPGGKAVSAGKITIMPRPMLGIGVSNRGDLIPRQQEETDNELRERARHALQRANLGTQAALEQAVRSLGVSQVTFLEEAPGLVKVILSDPDLFEDVKKLDALLQQARKAVEKVRPAGVKVEVKAFDPIRVQLTATLLLDAEYPPLEKKRIQDGIEQALKDYFAGLKVGESVRWDEVKDILTRPKEVVKVDEITPTPGYRYLEPFREIEGKLESARSILHGDDIQIGSTERAILDSQVLPPRLSLEPPELAVWVDVMAELAAGQTREDVKKKLGEMLSASVLDTFKPGETVTFERLNDSVQSVRADNVVFKIVHDRDGLAVLLTEKGDTDSLAQREKLKLGEIAVTGGQGG
ncbi:MAG: baseplate J/gp47 family protein [Candidatus Competibacteraceae bacterium]